VEVRAKMIPSLNDYLRTTFVTGALLALAAVLFFVGIAGSQTRNSFANLGQDALEKEIVDILQEDEIIKPTAEFSGQQIQFIENRIAPCVGTLGAARTVSFNIADLNFEDTTLRYSTRLGSDRVTIRMAAAYQAKSNQLQFEYEQLADFLKDSPNSENVQFIADIERKLSDMRVGYTLIRSCNGKTYLNEMITYQISFSVRAGMGVKFLALLEEYQVRFD